MKISDTKRLERLHDRYMNGGLDRRAFLGLTAGLERLGVSRVMLYMYLIPVAGVGLAAAFFGDPLTPARVLGGLIVLAGVVLTRVALDRAARLIVDEGLIALVDIRGEQLRGFRVGAGDDKRRDAVHSPDCPSRPVRKDEVMDFTSAMA